MDELKHKKLKRRVKRLEKEMSAVLEKLEELEKKMDRRFDQVLLVFGISAFRQGDKETASDLKDIGIDVKRHLAEKGN